MLKVEKFVADLIELATMRKTAYNNHYPNNIGKVQPDGTITFDCWNLIKSLLNGWDINRATEVGYVTPNLKTTGDLNGRQLLQHCSQCSQDFTKIKNYPAGTYLFMAETHSGTYIGDTEIDGKIYNVIECTGAWERKVLWSYVDEKGRRLRYKGSNQQCYSWTDFGLLTEWVDYGNGVVKPQIEPKPIPDYLPKYYIRYGTKGNEVRKLQKALNILGLLGEDGKVLDVDGDAGKNTIFALKSFQRSNGLEVDGDYGPLSQAQLDKSLKGRL